MRLVEQQTNEFYLKEAVSMSCRNCCREFADFGDVKIVFIRKLIKRVKPRGAFERKRVAVWTLSPYKIDPFSEVKLMGGMWFCSCGKIIAAPLEPSKLVVCKTNIKLNYELIENSFA